MPSKINYWKRKMRESADRESRKLDGNYRYFGYDGCAMAFREMTTQELDDGSTVQLRRDEVREGIILTRGNKLGLRQIMLRFAEFYPLEKFDENWLKIWLN